MAETLDLEQPRRHYYASRRNINPHGIIPTGFEFDLTAPVS